MSCGTSDGDESETISASRGSGELCRYDLAEWLYIERGNDGVVKPRTPVE